MDFRHVCTCRKWNKTPSYKFYWIKLKQFTVLKIWDVVCQFSRKNLPWNVWEKVLFLSIVTSVTIGIVTFATIGQFPMLIQGHRTQSGLFKNLHSVRDIFCDECPQLWNRLSCPCHTQTSQYQCSCCSKP